MDPFNYRMMHNAFNDYYSNLLASGFSGEDATRMACEITGIPLKSVLGDFGEDEEDPGR